MNRRLVGALMAVPLVCSCTPKPQLGPYAAYLRSNAYTPFAIPRSDWGAGTVVRFDGDAEALVARADQCLGSLDARDTTSAALSDFSYRLDTKDTVAIGLTRILGDSGRVRAALSANRVNNVSIHFDDPFEVALPELTIKQQIAKLGQQGNSACLEAITEQGHFIITRVLGAKSVRYSFSDSTGRALDVTAQLVQRFGGGADQRREFVGNTGLKINQPMMLGYRLWRVNTSAGFLESQIQIRELTREEIARVKALAASSPTQHLD